MVAVVIAAVLVRPGPIAPGTLSIQLAWTWILPALPVTTCSLSVVGARISMPSPCKGEAAQSSLLRAIRQRDSLCHRRIERDRRRAIFVVVDVIHLVLVRQRRQPE